MGTMNHNALIATTWNEKEADSFQEWLNEQPPIKQYVLRGEPLMNGYQTFVFVPDGSKEGWALSDDADKYRDQIIERLALNAYEDGSSCWDWVEVGFGEYGQRVTRGNNLNMYNDLEYAIDDGSDLH